MPLQRDDMYWHGGAPGLAAGQRIRPAAGITAADLRALGKVPRSDHLDEHAARLVVEHHGPERLAGLMRQKTSPGTAFGLEKG